MKKLQPWPLGIIIVYALFVLALLVYLLFASMNTVNLVTDDYYAQELRYQEQVDRINRTKALAAGPSWKYNKTGQYVVLQFPVELKPLTIAGNIVLFRPSDAAMDRKVKLRLSEFGEQKIDVSMLAAGFWRLKILWKRNKTEYYSEGYFIFED